MSTRKMKMKYVFVARASATPRQFRWFNGWKVSSIALGISEMRSFELIVTRSEGRIRGYRSRSDMRHDQLYGDDSFAVELVPIKEGA